VSDSREIKVDRVSEAAPRKIKRDDPALDDLLERVRRLPIKSRVRVIDALVERDITEREDGVRFSVRSLSEFKRFRKSKPADEPLI
jgi:hypothetical protein